AIGPLARLPAGRAALLTGLRSQPWLASEQEALALRDGFGACEDFWRLLWWGMLADIPTGLSDVHCPVILAQGTADIIASGQTPRYLLTLPSDFRTPTRRGPYPSVRHPRQHPAASAPGDPARRCPHRLTSQAPGPAITALCERWLTVRPRT